MVAVPNKEYNVTNCVVLLDLISASFIFLLNLGVGEKNRKITFLSIKNNT